MPKLRFILLSSFLALAACAQNPARGGYEFTLASNGELRTMGDAAANAVLKSDGLYRPESNATKYVDDLCNKIYATTEAASDPVQCNLLDNGTFNAFATPGYLFVNRGLLPFISSEAELAAVLGHESGHLTARHAMHSATQQRIASAVLTGAMVAVGQSGAGYAASQAASTAGEQAAEIGLQTFSRAHETEADALGRRYMERAGYDPHEALNMVRAMGMVDAYQQAQSRAFGTANQSLLAHLKSSHPATPERVAAALAATGEPPVVTPEKDLGRQRFMNAIEGLTFGPARRYGIARKAEIVLTHQRVAIPLPAGVITDYITSGEQDKLGTWLVAHPQSGVYVRLTSLKVVAGRNPGTLVQNMLPLMHGDLMRIKIGTEVPTLNPQTITETTGYTATYHYLNDDHRYRVLTVSAPTRVDEMLLLTVVYPSQDSFDKEDGNLMSILQKMKFLTEDQALKYKQLEVHTFIAATGDSVARQASRLPVGAMQEDLFRALNNLPTPAGMIPGQRYKTIVDLND